MTERVDGALDTATGAAAATAEPALEPREAWGMAGRCLTRVVRPASAADVVAAFELARARRWTVCAWGNGRSYGDAALNDGRLTLDMRDMRRILAFDHATGVVVAEPGLTLGELWRHVLPHGWWPPVVSGTMTTTLGGCAAANVHGKNNLAHGPFGEHVLGFTIVTPDGAVREVTPDGDPNLFHAAIGGFGALGAFTSITLQLKRVHSGRLDVQPQTHADLDSLFAGFDRATAEGWDYVVGWIDAFGRGSALGRGNLHAARYVAPGADPEAQAWLDPERQALPPTIFGFPKRWMWRLMKPFAHRAGMRLVNLGRYLWAGRPAASHRHLLAHARFNFLLDFVPDWKRVYAPDGLVQIQVFLPKERARTAIRRILEIQQAARYESWLVVMKRHRADPFWLSHAVDGYSFAMDFAVRPRRRAELLALGRRIEQVAVESGGRFYLAKDSMLAPSSLRASLGDEILGRFFGLKDALDPDGLLASNQYRRVLAPLRAHVPVLPLAPGEVFRVGPGLAALTDHPAASLAIEATSHPQTESFDVGPGATSG
jgi:decaprenylphospho-beta-D-ribofuranose 2-oxidase